VADCEFVQFHPTALAVGGLRRVLLTEALRGEGAIVVDSSGKRFLLDVHPDGELAPRDVVARAIAERGEVYLDARPIGADTVRRRFPHITEAVSKHGFDMTTELIPVAPAAHYFLGGVATDTSGRTTLPGLYAAGECAATGVHGANRMAGNSLAEAVVFGRRAALSMAKEAGAQPAAPPLLDKDEVSVRVVDTSAWGDLRAAMSNGAGLIRDNASLEATQRIVDAIAASATDDLRAAAIASGLICRSARARDESRGVHYRADSPQRKASWEGKHVTLA